MNENPFALVQIGMNSIRARQALIGTNRALNQTVRYLDEIPPGLFSGADSDLIDRIYEMIPLFKRRLDLLDEMLGELSLNYKAMTERDFEAYAHDFKITMDEISAHMENLGRVLMKHR